MAASGWGKRDGIVIDGGGGGKAAGFLKWAAGGVAALIAVLVLNPFVIVGPGERDVVMNFGAVQPDVLGEGLHLRIPIMQKVVLMDVKVQKEQVDADAASKDLQDTSSTVALNYHIDPDRANDVYQQIGWAFSDRVIAPAMQEAIKAVTAGYTAMELITQREKVRNEVRQQLRERLAAYNIIVDDFSIVNFSFSPQFTQAIESKQTAEQLALKAQRDLERIRIEAEQKVAQATAEAEALRLQKMEVTPQLVALRQIEVQQKAIDKWDGRLPQVTGGAMPFLDVMEVTGNANRR
jgi:regulator of protease activity HflC (stomatin/prohibitin superfamily)